MARPVITVSRSELEWIKQSLVEIISLSGDRFDAIQKAITTHQMVCMLTDTNRYANITKRTKNMNRGHDNAN